MRVRMTWHKSNCLLDHILCARCHMKPCQGCVFQDECKSGQETKRLRQEVHRQMRLTEAAKQEAGDAMLQLQGVHDQLNMVSPCD